jgi:hypothetical protein
MDGTAGGVFATHDPGWMPASNLDSILEERPSRLGDDWPQYIPSPKRLRTGFECDRCGKSFTEKRSLVRHNKHATNCKPGEQSPKPFTCTVCSKGFTRDDVRQSKYAARQEGKASLVVDTQSLVRLRNISCIRDTLTLLPATFRA